MDRFKSPAVLFCSVALVVIVWLIYAISAAYSVTEARYALIQQIRRNGGDVYEVYRFQGRDSKPTGGVGLWRRLFGDKAYGAVVVADEDYFADVPRYAATFPEASLIGTLKTINADTPPR